MPVVSMFYGIVMMMINRARAQHNLPHIYARSAEFEASISITGNEILAGSFQPKKLALVRAWIILHEDELLMNWQLCRAHQTPLSLPPLQ